MDHIESGSEGTSQLKQTQAPLISGLPDDIALFCLARVPRKYHTALRCVSRRWRDLLCSEEWRAHRRKHNLDETWIYALCRDNERVYCYVLDPNSTRRSWKPVRELPSTVLRRKGMAFEVLGKRVYLLGGSGWCEGVFDEVYCYDASMNKWTDSAPMSIPRCYFACEVLDEKIYAIGGLGSKSSDTHSWDVYDPCTNKWKLHKHPNIFPDIEDSFVMDGKIYIRMTFKAHAIVYEPSSGTWENVEANMASGWQGPAVVVDGTLYVLDQSSGTRLIMWQKESREWVPVGRLSVLLTRPPCKLVAIGKTIFAIGKGCSTVVIDVGKMENSGGLMMSTSIPELNSNDIVISCKCLAI